MVVSTGMVLGMDVSVTTRTELSRTPEGWNQELMQRWALAPKSLVGEGKINDDNYAEECGRIGGLGRKTIIENLIGKLIIVLGIGELRERSFVEEVNRRGVSVVVCDWSSVACCKASDFFAALSPPAGVINRVYCIDIEKLFMAFDGRLSVPNGKHEKQEWETIQEVLNLFLAADMLYAAQFVQVLDELGKDLVMKGVGKWVLDGSKRKAIIVHPLPKDNEGKEWGYTNPYKQSELLEPLRNQPRGGSLQLIGLYKEWYYRYHLYTALVVWSQ